MMDDVIHHMYHNTSMFHVVPSILRSAVHSEINAYNWLKSKFSSLGSVSGSASGARFVDYYAAACPHCKDLAPAWSEASQQWSSQHGHGVSWEAKECLDSQWKPGRDYEECQKEEVHGFPTVKFFQSASS